MSNTGDFSSDFSDDFLTTQGLGPAANPPAPFIRQAYDLLSIVSPIGTDVLVGTSSTQLVLPNPQRRAIAFSNASQNPYYVRPDNAAAVVGFGILIPPGDYVELSSDRDLVRYTSGWVGIGTVGGGGLTILEFLG